MTNKDAISIIKIIGEDYIPRTTFQEVNEALDIAIKALEQIDLIKFNIHALNKLIEEAENE